MKERGKERRKEPRYNLREFELKGSLVLFPDPRVLAVDFINISDSGACVSISTAPDPKLEDDLATLIKASKSGNLIPVQLIFNDVKIPVNILNLIDKNVYGLCISEHQKLSTLAEKGKRFFHEITQAAVAKGASESDFVVHTPIIRQCLPEEVLQYVESREFMTHLISALVNELPVIIPSLKDRAPNPEERLNVASFLLKFLEGAGKDVPLMAGSEILVLKKEKPAASLEQLMPQVVRNLAGKGAFSPGEGERRGFENVLNERLLKKKEPETLKELPPKHPLVGLINVRFGTFNRQTSFLRSLAPHVATRYLGAYIPRDSEMVAIFGGDERLRKKTFDRWVHNELNELAGRRDKKVATQIEDNFKQALYAYMTKRKSRDISSTEIQDIFEGNIDEHFRAIRNEFLDSICRTIESAVQTQFEQFSADTSEDRSKAQAEKEEDQLIQRMAPVELMIRFLWPKILELGEIVPLQREVARTWIPKERATSFIEMGNIVILSLSSLDEFLASARGIKSDGENPRDYFDEIDLKAQYLKTVDVGGEKRKDTFGLYVDTLQPYTRKELIMEKVINVPQWSKYYILKKPKNHFDKAFGKKAPVLCAFIEANMLATASRGQYI